MVEFDSVKVKDQLGRPENKNINVKRVSETIIIEDNAIVFKKHTRLHSWTVGSSTNGIVGTWTGTLDGEQLIVGREPTGVLQVITSSNKTFNERFIDTYFKDATSTCDWAGTVGELNFTTGEVALSESVAYNDGTISFATISVVVSSGSLSDLSIRLTANGGTNFESVTNATKHIFTNTGTDLRFEITASGMVKVTLVKIEYG